MRLVYGIAQTNIKLVESHREPLLADSTAPEADAHRRQPTQSGLSCRSTSIFQPVADSCRDNQQQS